MAKPLDQRTIKNLLRKDQEGKRGSQHAPVWPSKRDRKTLYEAAQKKQRTVTFADGRTFSIQYRTKKSIAWGEHELVYIKPIDGSVTPCGWFRIKSLLAEV